MKCRSYIFMVSTHVVLYVLIYAVNLTIGIRIHTNFFKLILFPCCMCLELWALSWVLTSSSHLLNIMPLLVESCSSCFVKMWFLRLDYLNGINPIATMPWKFLPLTSPSIIYIQCLFISCHGFSMLFIIDMILDLFSLIWHMEQVHNHKDLFLCFFKKKDLGSAFWLKSWCFPSVNAVHYNANYWYQFSLIQLNREKLVKMADAVLIGQKDSPCQFLINFLIGLVMHYNFQFKFELGQHACHSKFIWLPNGCQYLIYHNNRQS